MGGLYRHPVKSALDEDPGAFDQTKPIPESDGTGAGLGRPSSRPYATFAPLPIDIQTFLAELREEQSEEQPSAPSEQPDAA
jgi:hypothetical protein